LITTKIAAKVELAHVPFHPQTERDDCGPAALAMMLASTGLRVTPSGLAPKIYTPGRKGTLQSDIIQATRRAGRLGSRVRSLQELLEEIDAGNPVLVLQNLGLERWPKWHYAVAMGYELESRTLFLHSGQQAKYPTTFSAFLRTWDDGDLWGLAVTSPDHLPATVDEAETLVAANGLEQAGQQDAATMAYGAVLKRWPDNLPALIGWGNARYAAGDHLAASQAFRHAVTLHPEATEAWNNLAYSLAGQKRFDEAVEAAKEAIKLRGPHRAAAEATLNEIEARRG
jgi:tetratricopeptide (TPR) repeat protein